MVIRDEKTGAKDSRKSFASLSVQAAALSVRTAALLIHTATRSVTPACESGSNPEAGQLFGGIGGAHGLGRHQRRHTLGILDPRVGALGD